MWDFVSCNSHRQALWFVFLLTAVGISTITFLEIPLSFQQIMNEWPSPSSFPERDFQNRSRDDQRIVILAGPHKTGSSSIQINIWNWTISAYHSQDAILNDWAWPVPSIITHLEQKDHPKSHPSKGFYPLLELLADTRYQDSESLQKYSRPGFRSYTKSQVIDWYRAEIQLAWNAGYSIILACEAVDFIVKVPHGADLLDALVHVLPKDVAQHQISFAVAYRPPRIHQLVSIWHEFLHQKKSKTHRIYNTSMYEWLLTTNNNLGALDVLGMAELIANKGFHVYFLDEGGIDQEELDVTNVIACQILGGTCTKDAQLLHGFTQYQPIRTNVNSLGILDENMNLSQAQLNQMDRVLNLFDCHYKYLVNHTQITWIYPHVIFHVFDLCDTEEVIESRLIMKNHLQRIVLNP